MTSSAFFKPAASSTPLADMSDPSYRPVPASTAGDRRVCGEIRWPPMGSSGGRQRGDSVAAYGEIPMAAVTAGVIPGLNPVWPLQIHCRGPENGLSKCSVA
jgi:hypothetical protein